MKYIETLSNKQKKRLLKNLTKLQKKTNREKHRKNDFNEDTKRQKKKRNSSCKDDIWDERKRKSSTESDLVHNKKIKKSSEINQKLRKEEVFNQLSAITDDAKYHGQSKERKIHQKAERENKHLSPSNKYLRKYNTKSYSYNFQKQHSSSEDEISIQISLCRGKPARSNHNK